jgi:tetratricopeptide (TPR) repeat protein
VDGHIPEQELARFAADPDSVSVERRAELLQHLAGCAACRAKHDHFGAGDDDVADADTWEAATGSATLESLLAYAGKVAEEDLAAAPLLKEFFASPEKAAYKNLLLQSRYLHGGMVRGFMAHSYDLCANEPLDALTFAEAAVTIANALPDDIYPARRVYELRGAAWKEVANAQMFLGRLPAALESLVHAERAFKKIASPGSGLSSVALIRAGVFYQQQRLDEAARIAEIAEQGFAHLGDDDRKMAALYLRASIKYEAFELQAAAELFRQLRAYGEAANRPMWIGRALYALGDCEAARRNLGEASLLYQKALAILRASGPAVDRVRTEWGIARVLLYAGKASDAVYRLRDVLAEFESRGMVTDAALAGLDIADGLLALGHMRRIVKLAARLFRTFKDAGMLTGALTAIAYLKEAAAAGTLTSAEVDTVRKFIRRAERQPDLLFIPPPENR